MDSQFAQIVTILNILVSKVDELHKHVNALEQNFTKSQELSSPIIKSIQEDTSAIHSQSASTQVSINAILARLDTHELLKNNIATKRSIKTTQDTSQSVSKSPSTDRPIKDDNISELSSKEKKEEGSEKIINSLMFFKQKILYENYKGYKEKYNDMIISVTEEFKLKNDNSKKYWFAVGNNIWKVLKKDTEKLLIQELYKAWKAETCKDNQCQLDTDIDTNDGDN